MEPAAGRRLACAGLRVSSGRSFTGRILTDDGINQQHSDIAAVKKCAKSNIVSAKLCNIYELF